MEFSLLKYAGPNTKGVFKAFPEAGGSILKATDKQFDWRYQNIKVLGLTKYFSKLQRKESHLVMVVFLCLGRRVCYT